MNFSFAVLHCLADGGSDVDADAEENRIQVLPHAARVARVKLEVRPDRNLAAQDDAMIVSLGGRQNAPDHGLPARWRDGVRRAARVEIREQPVHRAALNMRHKAVRGERAHEEHGVGNRMGEPQIGVWRQAAESVLEVIGPIDRAFARAEAVLRIAGRRCYREHGEVVHDRVGKREAYFAVEIADAVARAASHRGLRRGGRMYEVHRNARVDSEIAVEVVADSAIQAGHAAEAAGTSGHALIENNAGWGGRGLLSAGDGAATYERQVESTRTAHGASQGQSECRTLAIIVRKQSRIDG